ncbi:MAG: acetyl-CoA hydrolase/transferase C-terminal domain-containing protein [Smithellaceae bacterium]|nr:acetyl-CoA hydrolase/transferase family protein [Syntrophaceae bacterium]MDD4240130.1 acetyl-CoA hydrolase/transferase C-terminal domain-containing protein [Smithellaceae bacterium]NLX51894.1 acetyl-CoA hydrolase/transferase family protein [Deltaproteobacteria bacterium]
MNSNGKEYAAKLTSCEQAASAVQDGDTVIHGITIAEPPGLLSAIAKRARAGEFQQIKVYTFNAQKHFAQTLGSPDISDVVDSYSWFVSEGSRNMVRVGLTQFIPACLHQIPKIVMETMDVNVVIAAVSPMNEDGYFSFGPCNGYLSVMAKLCRTLIVEVNQNMPFVYGDAMIHVSDVSLIVENTMPLMEILPLEPNALDPVIGKIVAGYIPDRAVIQLGIGTLPNAIAPCLEGHQDLGVHTELLCPGMVDLIKKGVITGRYKNIHTGKHVFSLAYGGRETFSFMDKDKSFENYPSSYVMNPGVIAQNHRMTSVNAILQIDLLGQCNAEFLAGHQYSGTGGQLDFVRGAYDSPEGKAILILYATAKNDEISRIVSRFPAGTMVTTPRNDVHYVATEYGIVNLKGKSTRARALALISIAHPKFRDELMRDAENMSLM